MTNTQVTPIMDFDHFIKKVISNQCLNVVIFTDRQCRVSNKQLKEVKEYMFGDDCAFWSCDVHDADEVARNNRISIAPTIVAFKHGQKLWEEITFQRPSDIAKRIRGS